jgi:hydrogenase nickel incorporation protein HypA/HybF
MHELAIIENILEISDRVARENNLSEIESIALVLGELQHLNAEILINNFNAARINTRAAHAELHISTLPVKLKCNTCNDVYYATTGKFSCPSCNGMDTSILQGMDLYIETIKGH